MSINHRRRNYFAGTSALAVSGQNHRRPDTNRRNGGSVPNPSVPLPGNVVELYPGTGGSSKVRRGASLLRREAGMATAEYAIATLAAVGFAGLLVFILRSDEVRGFLLTLIRTALALP